MVQSKEFNPIEAARRIEASYREYIATTIHFSDSALQTQLKDILYEDGYLAKGPFLEASPPYTKGQSVSNLVEMGVLCHSMLSLGDGEPTQFDPDRLLYVHQVKAINKAVSNRNYAVVTGTGSGKTECFMLPILNDILSEFELSGPSAGVRAMILYPMNALANDQLKRLRSMLKGTEVTFGRYTGDTEEKETKAASKWAQENPNQRRLGNEIISREEIRRTPPNILLTNYSMLEYLLLRPKDAPLFGKAFGSCWRHIAIDEAHVYSGALGTEIAYLLRRLKARIESETGARPALRCYATSATIGSAGDMPKVASFAQNLFGEPFSSDPSDLDVVTSEKDLPQNSLDPVSWGTLPLNSWTELRAALSESDEDKVPVKAILSSAGIQEDVLKKVDDRSLLQGVGLILLGEGSTKKLVMRSSELIDLTDSFSIGEIGIEGLSGDASGIRTLTAMVEVLSIAQRSNGVPILSSRYHSFLRAPEGIYLNLATNTLIPNKMVEMPCGDGQSTPIYEASVCRHCGQAYILGQETSSGGKPWLSSKHNGTNADDEFIPNKYYRLLESESEKDPDEEVQWLCPICGSLHIDPSGGPHLFKHDSAERVPISLNKSESKQANEQVARCRHCGYQSVAAIQPMRVSPEAAGSVVCYDLVREIPPFKKKEGIVVDDLFSSQINEERHAGSVICFSDRRQDAAFFAPAMDRTYGSITKRQLIREAVATQDIGSGCSVPQVINWISSVIEKRYASLLNDDSKSQVTAWLLDELAAEDSRNSLEGLGLIKIEPTVCITNLSKPAVASAINTCVSSLSQERLSWLTEKDFALFVKVSFEFLRERDLTEVEEGICKLRENREKSGNRVKLGGDRQRGDKHCVLFSGSGTDTTENAFSAFIRKYALAVHQTEISRDDSVALLQFLFKFLGQYLNSNYIPRKPFSGTTDCFSLKKEIWTLYRTKKEDVMYRCPSCGCETHLDTNGVCMTHKCHGKVEPVTVGGTEDKDRYYKEAYLDEALPLRIEEHTAQLSSKKAREIQSQFIDGDVNILSCTTTFELGVDVGDLRAIFMRNVPPTTANYTQRAGRVGRRAGKPGYAVTFARLRPHDIAFFNNPSKIIAGEARVPACFLDNSAIALRHVFAVALSEFFRELYFSKNVDYSHVYNDFMDLADSKPDGLTELRNYLELQPAVIGFQLDRILPPSDECRSIAEIADWRWVDMLIGIVNSDNRTIEGRLLRTHALKHADYQRIQDGIEQNCETNDMKASLLMRTKSALKQELTISVLAENGILPKYGFPTDLVELHLPEQDCTLDENRLSLSRGMRQAIREYAPGAEIVAGKTLWRSSGIRKPKDGQLEMRRYGKCPSCKAFVWPIENYTDTNECPVCHTKFELRNKMLIPTYGFEGYKVSKGVGLRKPRNRGHSEVFFSQHWPSEAISSSVSFRGGTVHYKYAGNGQLCVLNAPRKGLRVCTRCNAASTYGQDIKHQHWCKGKSERPFIDHFDALAASFVSDVLELIIDIEPRPCTESYEWASVMWALFSAASIILELPEAELGGTMYANPANGVSIMIYDDVPGGAGHARQLNDDVKGLFEEAYKVVDGHCGCGEETCCYGCIANYYNQSKQADLSRGAAKKILGLLLGKQPPVHVVGAHGALPEHTEDH